MQLFDLTRLARFFVTTRILGRHHPLLASFKLTYRCNLACQACPFHQRAGAPAASITWDMARACLDELKRRGCQIVIFEGGEPLIWRDGGHTFAELCAYAKDKFLRIGATTNGTLPLDVPTDILWVSLDGSKETHDRLRSRSYDRVLENITRSTHPRLYCHCTLNRDNWRELPQVARTVANLPQVRGLTVQYFYPYGQGEADLALTPEERRQAVNLTIALKRQGYPILNSTQTLKTMIGNTWRCHPWLLANAEPDGTVSTGCYVQAHGRIASCCQACGFTPVAEASRAMDLKPGAVLAGWRIFL